MAVSMQFSERGCMAFGLFRKRPPQLVAPVGPPAAAPAAAGHDAASVSGGDSSREILRAARARTGLDDPASSNAPAHSVAGGAEATAATLSTIRERTDALTGRSGAAQSTATVFSQAADKFTRSAEGIGSQVRDASNLADQASAAAREASLNVDRLKESSAAIGDIVNLITKIAKQTTLLALNSTIEAARGRQRRGRGVAGGVATEVKALAVQTQHATEEITKKIEALQKDAAGSVDAVHRIAQAIEVIRPVFSKRPTARWPSRTRPPARCPTTPPARRASSSRSATAPPRSTAPPGRPKPMASASPTPQCKAVTRSMFAHAKTQGPLCGAAAPGRSRGSPQGRKSCPAIVVKIEDPDPRRKRRVVTAPVYEISMEGDPDLRSGRRDPAC